MDEVVGGEEGIGEWGMAGHNQSGSHFRTLIDNNRGGSGEGGAAMAQKTGIEWIHRRRWCR